MGTYLFDYYHYGYRRKKKDLKCGACKLDKPICICGAPRILKSKEYVLERWAKYLKECKDDGQLPTKAGWILALGLSDRKTYNEYKSTKTKKGQEFSNTLKRIELELEDAWVQRLNGGSVTGIIFYLKNAFKEEYQDSSKVDLNSTIEVTKSRKKTSDSLLDKLLG